MTNHWILGYQIFKQPHLRSIWLCVFQSYQTIATHITNITCSQLVVKVASPVNQSPAIARRMDDFPIPGAFDHSGLQSIYQESQMQKIEEIPGLSCQWSRRLNGVIDTKGFSDSQRFSAHPAAHLVQCHMTESPQLFAASSWNCR